jgi:hypothetical protein
MQNYKKLSFAVLFTALYLTVILFITVSVSLVFFINFYAVSRRQVITNTSESINNLRDPVVDQFAQTVEVFFHSGVRLLYSIEVDGSTAISMQVSAIMSSIEQRIGVCVEHNIERLNVLGTAIKQLRVRA